MGSNDQEKIEIAREYFMRADQGNPDSGESDEHLSGEFFDLWKDQLVLGTLNLYLLILKR